MTLSKYLLTLSEVRVFTTEHWLIQIEQNDRVGKKNHFMCLLSTNIWLFNIIIPLTSLQCCLVNNTAHYCCVSHPINNYKHRWPLPSLFLLSSIYSFLNIPSETSWLHLMPKRNEIPSLAQGKFMENIESQLLYCEGIQYK